MKLLEFMAASFVATQTFLVPRLKKPSICKYPSQTGVGGNSVETWLQPISLALSCPVSSWLWLTPYPRTIFLLIASSDFTCGTVSNALVQSEQQDRCITSTKQLAVPLKYLVACPLQTGKKITWRAGEVGKYLCALRKPRCLSQWRVKSRCKQCLHGPQSLVQLSVLLQPFGWYREVVFWFCFLFFL